MPDTPARPELPEGTPERIYLNLGTDDGIVPIPFAQLGEVTWCEDRIDRGDPEYIRADLVLRQADEFTRLLAEERRKALEEVAQRFKCEQFNTSAKLVRSMIDRKEPTT